MSSGISPKQLAKMIAENPDLQIDAMATAVGGLLPPGIAIMGREGKEIFTPDIVGAIQTLSADSALHNAHVSGSGSEYRFALLYLEARVESGESIGWAHEPMSIRMVGQTYTPDFVEWGADGVTRFYEVKGSQKLGSQDRASAKYRMTAAMFESEMIEFLWAKENEGSCGKFAVKKLPMQGKRAAHSYLRSSEK